MKRCLFLAAWTLVLGLHGIADGGDKKQIELTVQGKLTKDDPTDKRRNAARQIHTLKMKSGRVYTIDMVGKGFDAYLFLDDAKNNQLDQDDDSGGNLNARIIFNCTRDGEYRIVCTAFSADGVGDYTLTVTSIGGGAKSVSSHDALVGKPAVDFVADFTINAKAAKLADLKGKVVLLSFWDVRMANCAATFPSLRDWHKTHKDAGLEIVGVSFYQYQIGQRFAFDKENGVLKKVDNADKKSEQTMLRDFAAHHKLEHRLVTLAKDEALALFNAFGVNGVPQFVLIDRKGMVRFIRVGEDEKVTGAVEEEIKKLLSAQ